MKELIETAERLKQLVKQKEDEIDNPILTLSMITDLEYFIENVSDEE